MYWKEFSTGGYYWYQSPIESQAMMVEAFSDIDKNTATVDDLKTWLLKNKQTTNWKNHQGHGGSLLCAIVGRQQLVGRRKGGNHQPRQHGGKKYRQCNGSRHGLLQKNLCGQCRKTCHGQYHRNNATSSQQYQQYELGRRLLAVF